MARRCLRDSDKPQLSVVILILVLPFPLPLLFLLFLKPHRAENQLPRLVLQISLTRRRREARIVLFGFLFVKSSEDEGRELALFNLQIVENARQQFLSYIHLISCL